MVSVGKDMRERDLLPLPTQPSGPAKTNLNNIVDEVLLGGRK
jgi:hypothetical protein